MKIKSLCFKREGRWFTYCSKCGTVGVYEARSFMLDSIGELALFNLIDHMSKCKSRGESQRALAFFKMLTMIREGFQYDK